MIACKEELLNTYIINDKGALRDAYLGKLKEFGFEWYFQSGKPAKHHLNAFEILVNANNKIDWNDKVNNGMKSRKRLTISDFKPTHTEYVKVTDSIFDLKAELEAGELYVKHKNKDKHYQINSEQWLVSAKNNGNVYRKVEHEITWQDELRNAIKNGQAVGLGSIQVGEVDLTDGQFIEMCHKVYHLTK